MSKPIQEAITIIKNAKQQINKLLSGPQHNQNLLEINANFTRIENRLGFMGAVLEPEKNRNGVKKRFPPMTSFMGQPIKKEADGDELRKLLTPDEETKKRYQARVDKLWKDIGNFTPDHILKNFRIQQDILVLRGVANRAGVKDFETAELTTEFIEAVQKAVDAKKKERARQAEIDRKAKPGAATDEKKALEKTEQVQ